ncbi:MAG TPA: 7-cyano-7-deazaguanine synthase, partial [Thermoplasmata archaeon]|nr:7-cyano-7-deazaguanine synthase [Thermoplasmata archaeon]
MSPAPRPSSVVLLSGGMDSATCLALAARRGPVHALSVEYGQRHARELGSARRLARHFRVASHLVVRMPIGPLLDSALTRTERPLPRAGRRGARTAIPATYVPARNTLLLALALGVSESRGATSIYLGANAI